MLSYRAGSNLEMLEASYPRSPSEGFVMQCSVSICSRDILYHATQSRLHNCIHASSIDIKSSDKTNLDWDQPGSLEVPGVNRFQPHPASNFELWGRFCSLQRANKITRPDCQILQKLVIAALLHCYPQPLHRVSLRGVLHAYLYGWEFAIHCTLV